MWNKCYLDALSSYKKILGKSSEHNEITGNIILIGVWQASSYFTLKKVKCILERRNFSGKPLDHTLILINEP